MASRQQRQQPLFEPLLEGEPEQRSTLAGVAQEFEDDLAVHGRHSAAHAVQTLTAPGMHSSSKRAMSSIEAIQERGTGTASSGRSSAGLLRGVARLESYDDATPSAFSDVIGDASVSAGRPSPAGAAPSEDSEPSLHFWGMPTSSGSAHVPAAGSHLGSAPDLQHTAGRGIPDIPLEQETSFHNWGVYERPSAEQTPGLSPSARHSAGEHAGEGSAGKPLSSSMPPRLSRALESFGSQERLLPVPEDDHWERPPRSRSGPGSSSNVQGLEAMRGSSDERQWEGGLPKSDASSSGSMAEEAQGLWTDSAADHRQERWQRISSLPRFAHAHSMSAISSRSSAPGTPEATSKKGSARRRHTIGHERRRSGPEHWGHVEKAACLVEQAMHGHVIPVDVVLNDDSGSTSGAYLVYQKLGVLRHAMVVTLLLLPFFEIPQWCDFHKPTDQCGDRDEFGLSGVAYLPAWITFLVEVACMAVATTCLALQHHYLGSTNFRKNKIAMYKTFFLAALVTGRVLIAVAWLSEDYSPQHSQAASAAAYTSTPFLHIILALLFSKAIRGCVRIALRIIAGFFDVLVLICFYVVFAAWLTFALFAGTDAGREMCPTLGASLRGMFVLLTTANNPDYWVPAFRRNRLSFFFFAGYLAFGLFFLMNLVLSVVYNSYKSQIAEWGKKRVAARSECLRAAFEILDVDNKGWVPSGTITALLSSMESLRDVPNLKQKAAALFRSLDRRGDFRIWDDEFDDLCEVLMHQFQGGFWQKAPLLQRTLGGRRRAPFNMAGQGRGQHHTAVRMPEGKEDNPPGLTAASGRRDARSGGGHEAGDSEGAAEVSEGGGIGEEFKAAEAALDLGEHEDMLRVPLEKSNSANSALNPLALGPSSGRARDPSSLPPSPARAQPGDRPVLPTLGSRSMGRDQRSSLKMPLLYLDSDEAPPQPLSQSQHRFQPQLPSGVHRQQGKGAGAEGGSGSEVGASSGARSLRGLLARALSAGKRKGGSTNSLSSAGDGGDTDEGRGPREGEGEEGGAEVDCSRLAQMAADHWLTYLVSQALLAAALVLVLTTAFFRDTDLHVWLMSAEYSLAWVLVAGNLTYFLAKGDQKVANSAVKQFDLISTWPLVGVGVWALIVGPAELDPLWIELVLIFRCLRLLRLSKHFPRGHVIFSTVTSLVPMLLPILGLQYVVCALFSLLGMRLFGGSVYASNPRLAGTEYLAAGFVGFNYNDFGAAMTTSFNLCVVNNWFVIMDGVTAASGKAWEAPLFFVSFYFVVVVFVLNVVVAFLLEAFLSKLSEHDSRTEGSEDEKLRQKIRMFTAKHGAHFHNSSEDFFAG